MTDQTNSTELPAMGTTHEPVYTNDHADVARDKLRSFLTRATHIHEQNRKAQEEDEMSLPCLSLAVPCYLASTSAGDYSAALSQQAANLATLSDEANRLGYTVLAATPAVYAVDEGGTYQSPVDRAPGWTVELTATEHMSRFFDGDKDNNTLTRLWLELSIKNHGPSYVRVMQEAQAGNEVNRKLKEIMASGNLRH